jgi:photosystem II stability/assembly factor-like uncharacterized protein
LVHVLASLALLCLSLIFVEATPASAVGSSGWSSSIDIDGSNDLTSVSCVNTSFCVAVDNDGHVLITSNGGSSWSGASDIDSHPLASVSCVSMSFCVAVDNDGYALTYNGSSWSAPSDIAGTDVELLSVSCPSTSFCAAVGDGYALTYNGSSWSAPSRPDGSNILVSVSCPSTSFCAAVDNDGNALTYNGSSWSAPSEIDGAVELTSVSCPSTSFCAAVAGISGDVVGTALTYNGSSWSAPSEIDGSNILVSVSCASTNFCIAVDNDGNVVITFNGGSSWSSSPIDIDGSNDLTSVSCTTSFLCAAVDGDGNALTYKSPPEVSNATRGGTWTVYPETIGAASPNATSVEMWLFGGKYGFAGAPLCTATSPWFPGSSLWLCDAYDSQYPGGSYVVVAEAFNAFGSTYSAGVSVNFNDTPTTSVLVPSNGATVSGSTTLDASATNATSVGFVLFGGVYGYSGKPLCTATLSYYGWLCSWNTATVPNGSYTLLSGATNASGSAYSAGVSLTVKN